METTTTNNETRNEMKDQTIETRKGSRVVISDNRNTGGVWESRLYVNGGETATLTATVHKTQVGAIRWAKRILE